MNPKPAYQALDELINHEWKTNQKMQTDASGKASFHGFHGKYLIHLTAGGVTRVLPFELKKSVEQNQTTVMIE